MRKLKISQLETFMVYMKTGSVTQAAQQLRTTQPNASKKLKQIEDTLGFPLFARAGGKLHPTAEAEVFCEHVTRLMRQLDLIEAFGLDSSPLKKVSLRIATLATFGVAVIPMATERFLKAYPNVHIQIDVLDSEKIYGMVAQGAYDFGLVHYLIEEPELTSQTLAQSDIVCLVPRGHPLAGRRVIRASDLKAASVVFAPTTVHMGAVITKMLSDQGIVIDQSVSANHSHVVRKFVERGSRIGLVDRFAVWDSTGEEPFVIRPFQPSISVALGLIVPQRRPLSRVAHAFVKEIGAVTSATE